MSGENRWNPIEGRIVGGCAAGAPKTRTVQPYSEDFLRLVLRIENEKNVGEDYENHGRDDG